MGQKYYRTEKECGETYMVESKRLMEIMNSNDLEWEYIYSLLTVITIDTENIIELNVYFLC